MVDAKASKRGQTRGFNIQVQLAKPGLQQDDADRWDHPFF
jgi:hypothetical protein